MAEVTEVVGRYGGRVAAGCCNPNSRPLFSSLPPAPTYAPAVS